MKRREFIKSLFVAAVASQVPVDCSPPPPLSLYGIPYHQSNAFSGTWLGIDRSTYPQWSSKVSPAAHRDVYKALVELVRKIRIANENRRWPD
jgi:hypothetical protein